MKRALAILPLLLGLPLAAPALAAAPTAQEIVQRTDQVAYYAAQDGRAKVRMRITDPQGRTRTRQFIILRRDGSKPGEQKYYVYFQRPADLAQTVFMVWKHANTDDDRWLYLPGLDLVKRIAAADRRTSFAGSDFLYEDVSGRSITDALLGSAPAWAAVPPEEPELPAGLDGADMAPPGPPRATAGPSKARASPTSAAASACARTRTSARPASVRRACTWRAASACPA